MRTSFRRRPGWWLGRPDGLEAARFLLPLSKEGLYEGHRHADGNQA